MALVCPETLCISVLNLNLLSSLLFLCCIPSIPSSHRVKSLEKHTVAVQLCGWHRGTFYPAQGKLVPVQTSLQPGFRSKVSSLSEGCDRAHNALVIGGEGAVLGWDSHGGFCLFRGRKKWA